MLFIILLAEQATAQSPHREALMIDSLAGEVRVPATFHPKNFSGMLWGLVRVVPEYHFLVWDDGRASHEALFVTSVSDSRVVAALEKIGAQPGNNLTRETWDKRHDANHPAPQARISGTRVAISILSEGAAKEIRLSDLLDDSGSKGFDFRFGGNLEHQHHWHSGCVVCLYSCPGSKVGNAAYTVRDYVTKQTRFSLKQRNWPAAGTKATIIFRKQE
ncbi:MAG: YdjY domain-containing protein [Gammaproteobacteria bacterium]